MRFPFCVLQQEPVAPDLLTKVRIVLHETTPAVGYHPHLLNLLPGSDETKGRLKPLPHSSLFTREGL